MAFSFAYPGEGVIDTVAGLFGSIGSDVKDFVTSVVKAAADALWDAVNIGADALRAVVNDVIGLIVGLRNLIADSIHTVSDWVQALFDQAIAFVRDGITYAIDTAKSLIGPVYDFVRSLYNSALALIDAVYSTVSGWIASAVGAVLDFARSLFNLALAAIDAVYSTVSSWIASAVGAVLDFARSLFNLALAAIDAVYSTVSSWIASAVGVAVDFLRGLVNDVWGFIYDHVIGPFEDLSSFVWDRVRPLVDAVEGAIDWLVAIAKFSFLDAYEWALAIWHLNPWDLIESMMQEGTQHAEAVFHAVNQDRQR